MKKIFTNIIIIALLLFTLFYLYRTNKAIILYDNESIDAIIVRLDSLYLQNKVLTDSILNKINIIEVEEQTIINNYEKVKNAIIDGDISDDSLVIFISSEIHNRRKSLLLLHSR